MDTIEEKLNAWLLSYPHSGHPLDQERYFTFIDAVVAYDDYISADWFRRQLEMRNSPLDEQQVNRLVAQFEIIVSYGKHCTART